MEENEIAGLAAAPQQRGSDGAREAKVGRGAAPQIAARPPSQGHTLAPAAVGRSQASGGQRVAWGGRARLVRPGRPVAKM